MNILKTVVKSPIIEKIALKTEINDLRNEVKQIKENEVSETAPAESIIMELLERQRREANIMIANVRESQATTPGQRKEEDVIIFKEILQKVSVNVNLDIITMFRVG
ncbi:hypothetical protein JTB14_011026 [Gonioctena quinquepunctata]|nr:hypothetical protein JTB14_011026 [Gonioctena quinquepunctata]